MERIVFFVCLCVAVEGNIGKHVFIDEPVHWAAAQAYCRRHHTDLSFFTSQSEVDDFLRGGQIRGGWIGLRQNPDDGGVWLWSGGGRATWHNWWDGEPNNRGNDNYGFVLSDGRWLDLTDGFPRSFYCVDVSVEEDRKSWEDALDHCRGKQADLPSLISDTHRLLVRDEMERKNTSERLWTGLRFLGDGWMWVNGDPLGYEAWSPQGGQQCPVRRRCGATPKRCRSVC